MIKGFTLTFTTVTLICFQGIEKLPTFEKHGQLSRRCFFGLLGTWIGLLDSGIG